jgi:hypothetical protein
MPCPAAASRSRWCCPSPGWSAPPLRSHPAGAPELRRPAQLHPGVRALGPGVEPADDHPGCGPTPPGQWGHDHGPPEALPGEAVPQAPTGQAEAGRHRRDRHRQRAPLPDGGVEPGGGGGGVRRRRQRGRRPGPVLEAAASGAGQGGSGGDGHVAWTPSGRSASVWRKHCG